MSENLSLEDVLDALVFEEPKPTYEALLRWSERYPQYRDALAKFFATWAVQAELPQRVQVDEERLAERGVRYAMEILGRQGRLAPEPATEPLAPLDQLVLAAVYLLRGKGRGVDINDKVGEISGKTVMLSTTLASLHRLKTQDLVSWRFTDPAAEPGRKPRRYFTVTLASERALSQATAAGELSADLLGDLGLPPAWT